MQLRLQEFTEDSIDTLVNISKTTFSDAFKKDNDPQDFKTYIETAFDRSKLKEELLNENSDFYLVTSNARPAAYFKLNQHTAQTDLKLPEALELERIYVLQEFQGQKIGQWMLDEIKKIAAEAKKEFIWLGVWEKNTKAITFYEKNGFSKFGMHPYYIGKDKQMDWMMRFDL
ncbi:MAG: N-acetyltransferase [Flavobacteriaceae bacterium]